MIMRFIVNFSSVQWVRNIPFDLSHAPMIMKTCIMNLSVGFCYFLIDLLHVNVGVSFLSHFLVSDRLLLH